MSIASATASAAPANAGPQPTAQPALRCVAACVCGSINQAEYVFATADETDVDAFKRHLRALQREHEASVIHGYNQPSAVRAHIEKRTNLVFLTMMEKARAEDVKVIAQILTTSTIKIPAEQMAVPPCHWMKKLDYPRYSSMNSDILNEIALQSSDNHMMVAELRASGQTDAQILDGLVRFKLATK